MAGFIPKDFIASLLNRVDIVEVVNSAVPLKKMGANFKACCPFHNEKTPSFNVNSGKQIFHCFGCGAGGDAISFVMQHYNIDFVEAVEKIAEPLGITVPRENNYNKHSDDNSELYQFLSKVAEFYHSMVDRSAPQTYLQKRGLSSEIAEKFQLGYVPQGWDALLKRFGSADAKKALLKTGMLIKKEDGGCYDRFRDRLMFPIRDRRGRVIGFGGRVIDKGEPKYLNSPETPLFHKGRELYGLYEARRASKQLSRLLIVEGYMDVIALAQFGITYAVATLGTATSKQHFEVLFRYTSELVFCFDGDQAGQKAAWRALETALPLLREGLQVNFMFLPTGEDPDSQVRQDGLDGFVERIEQSKSLAQYFFECLVKQVNLSQVEGKAKLVALVKPYINSVSSTVFQHLLISELALLVQMPENKLHATVLEVQSPVAAQQSGPAHKKAGGLSVVRYAMMLLLQYPELIQSVPGGLGLNSQVPGCGLLQQLIDHLMNHPYQNIEGIIESWPDKKQADLLMKVYQLESSVPESGLEDEFKGALKQAQRQGSELQIEALLAKAKSVGLQPEERQELQKLIQASHQKQ